MTYLIGPGVLLGMYTIGAVWRGLVLLFRQTK